MKSGYVYCLRFRSTQFYVGSSLDAVKRVETHRRSCFSKRPSNKFMSSVWKKYGEPELYILSKVPVELLQQEEQKFIDLVFGKEGCLNLNPYADRPPSWKGKKRKTHSAEHRAKMSASLKGKKRGPCSPETKAKISATKKTKPPTFQKGKEHSTETKAKISVSKKGKGNKPVLIGNITFISITEASNYFGVSQRALRYALKRGNFRSLKIEYSYNSK